MPPGLTPTSVQRRAGGKPRDGERAIALPVECPQARDDQLSGPLCLQLMRIPADVQASHFYSVMLAVHAKAITRNLECVLISLDPEGPHQLRVSLRRLRVVLRAFGAVMRATTVERLTDGARRIGSIVSELRDADVLIDELIGPAAAGNEGARLMKGLGSWRQEVRGRVRARLVGAESQAFAANLAGLAGTFAWRKKRGREYLASELIAPFVERCALRVAEAVAGLSQLPREKVHDVRKDVKALRYAVDLADALSLNRDADLPRRLKQAQDALGYVNDMWLLEGFSPPLVSENASLAALRDRLVADRARVVASNLSGAATRLHDIQERCSRLNLAGRF